MPRIAWLAALLAFAGRVSALESYACSPTTGLSSPVAACTAANPCTKPDPSLNVSILSTPTQIPVCHTTQSGRPSFSDDPPDRGVAADGVDRYACVFRPSGASRLAPRPLVLFFHGGLSNAATIYNGMSLRSKAIGFDLTGDPLRPGFFLVSVQGRNLNFPTEADPQGPLHDFFYRDLKSPSSNPDVANADRLIDEFVTTGAVDRSRIYVMGWSNGGFFAQMYAIARHATPTPGGNRVAAAAIYSSADPFNGVQKGESPSCQLNPYPLSTVPIFLTSRSCDYIACDEAQSAHLVDQGQIVPPGYIVGPWISTLINRVGDPNVRWMIVRGDGPTVSACTPPLLCPYATATVNHIHWPDGVEDGSGIDHEPEILGFLRDNPLVRTHVLAPRR